MVFFIRHPKFNSYIGRMYIQFELEKMYSSAVSLLILISRVVDYQLVKSMPGIYNLHLSRSSYIRHSLNERVKFNCAISN